MISTVLLSLAFAFAIVVVGLFSVAGWLLLKSRKTSASEFSDQGVQPANDINGTTLKDAIDAGYAKLSATNRGVVNAAEARVAMQNAIVEVMNNLDGLATPEAASGNYEAEVVLEERK